MDNRKSKAPNLEILGVFRRSLELQEGVQGFLEPCTGLIRLNCSADDYKTRMKLPLEHGGVREVFLHETFHYSQVAICGFLYRHSAIINSVVEKLLHYKGSQAERSEVLLAKERLCQSLAELHRDTLWGVSALGIMESLTFFLQVQGLQDLPQKAYLAYLERQNIADHYKLAYMAMVEAGVEDRHFPFIAQLSLCFASPASAYFELLDLWGGAELNGDVLLPDMLNYCRLNMPGYLGWSWETGERHPIYDELLKSVVADGNDELFSLIILDPMRIWDPRISSYFEVPLVLNPIVSTVNPSFRDYPIVRGAKIGKDQVELRLAWLVCALEVCRDTGLVDYIVECMKEG